MATGGSAPRGTKPPNAGKGRKKGVPNKSTKDVRACVAMIAQNLAPEVEGWIRKGSKKNPLGAANLLATLLEYHIPKLSRTEMTGLNGKPMEVTVVRYSDPQSVGSSPVPVPPVVRP